MRSEAPSSSSIQQVQVVAATELGQSASGRVWNMLLSQCLAISLSPSIAESRRPLDFKAQGSRESALRLLRQLLEENQRQDKDKPEVAGISDQSKSGEEEERFVALEGGRSAEVASARLKAPAPARTIREQEQRSQLAESLARLELAGFVLPGWLLVSGSLDDLERVRSSWFAGQLRAPPGFRLETIGNIRSVNVDYFELPNSNPKQQLESAVLSAVGELACQGPKHKPVHVGQLLEHLKPRLGQSTTTVSLVDRTINELVRDARLCLQPMTQQQVAETLADRRNRLESAQSVFLDQLIAPNNKSTTLDSGIQSMSAPSPTSQGVTSNFRLSLRRSLSFKAPRVCATRDEEPDLGKTSAGATAKSLAGLLRSRSMRVISSARRAASEKRPQATIDYLSSGQVHRRRATSVQARFREASASRLGLFLRRLFAGRRRQPISDSRIVETHSSGQALHDSLPRVNDAWSTCRSTTMEPIAEPSSLSPANRASSSSSSSGANSLIEILDCSPELGNSRRQLRHEQAPAATNRASWRLIQRSDSNLSHNSTASSSTTKSTASQQLRRHLDEAYRRHRTCTSQRDKEFIDSINILRQASRHALQNSRSSSKNRRAKSVAISDDTASSLDSTCDSPAHLDRREHTQDLMPPDERLDCCGCPAHLCPLACLPYDCCSASHQLDEFASPDLCCPIWRSILAKYWPPTFAFPHGDPNILVSPSVNAVVNGQDNLQASRHQHQHNTTIDLKIEIGSNLHNQQQTFTAGGPSCLVHEPNDDSLDSYRTDGSLSKPQGLESTGPQSESLIDSLQGFVQS